MREKVFVSWLFFSCLFPLNGVSQERINSRDIIEQVIAAQPQSQKSIINIWENGHNLSGEPDKLIEANGEFGDEYKIRMNILSPRNNPNKEYLAITEKNSAKTRLWVKRRDGRVLEIRGESTTSRNLENTGLSQRDLQKESLTRFNYSLLRETNEWRIVKAVPRQDDGWHRLLYIDKEKGRPIILKIEVFEKEILIKTILNKNFLNQKGIWTPIEVVVKQNEKIISVIKLTENELNNRLDKNIFNPANLR